jgi:hypothetical protein
MKTEERMRMAGIISGVCAVVFAVPHFWFWCGVSLAYPGDFQEMSNDGALLIVGGLAVLAAICAIAFTHSPWIRRLPGWATTLPALAVSVGLTFWGLAYFGLQILLAFDGATSSEQYFASEANPNAVWGLYWYSLFIAWGVSLGMAALYLHELKKRQAGAEHEDIREARGLAGRKQRAAGRDPIHDEGFEPLVGAEN